MSNINNKTFQDTFFTKVEIIQIPRSKLEVELYHNTLDEQKIEKFRNDIADTFINFKESFDLKERNCGPHKFKCYVFDSIESYKKDGSEIFHLDTKPNVGLARSSYYGYAAEIYFGQCPEDSRILKHEMAHGLTFYLMGKRSWVMPTAIIEGIASFIEHKEDIAFNNQLIEEVKSSGLTPSEIYKLTYNDGKKAYHAGHVLVMFLEEKAPHLIDRVLENVRYRDHVLITKVFEDELKHLEKDFSDWLDHKSTEINSFDFYNSIYNSTEEEAIFTADSDHEFSIAQAQNDYQSNIAAEYYI